MRVGVLLAVVAIIALGGCAGGSGGTCQMTPVPASLAGTPIPAQPFPSGSHVTSAVNVVVSVTVNASGAPTAEQIQSSSNDAAVDRAAIAAAARAAYRAGLPGCSNAPAPDIVVVTVPFSPTA